MQSLLQLTLTSKLLVSLAEAKRHLGLSDDEHDLDVEQLIRAATNYITRRTSRAVVDTTCLLTIDSCDWPAFTRIRIELPYGPVRAVSAVTYVNVLGVETALAGYQAATDDIRGYIVPGPQLTWPDVQADRVDAVKITYQSGPAGVPMPEATHAAKLLIRHWYDNPSAVITSGTSSKVEVAVDSLCRSLGVGRYAYV